MKFGRCEILDHSLSSAGFTVQKDKKTKSEIWFQLEPISIHNRFHRCPLLHTSQKKIISLKENRISFKDKMISFKEKKILPK